MRPSSEIVRREERLRYELLRCVYERAGPRGDIEVPEVHVAMSLGLDGRELQRLAAYLSRSGHLTAGGRSMCITPDGIHYMERIARRRSTVRD